MDLKKKLEYYRKTTAGNFSRQEQKSAPRIPASVKAIAEHFKAKILPYPVPVLEISMTEDKEFEGESVKLNRLSKNQFTEPILLEDCLFFDLETTGLSGGTGTYPFLLGFGYFEGEQFKVVQYFCQISDVIIMPSKRFNLCWKRRKFWSPLTAKAMIFLCLKLAPY